MEKNEWNWKNSLVSSLVGFLVGRYINQVSTQTSSPNLQPILSEHLPEEQVQLLKEYYVQAVLLVFGLFKEGSKELGHEFDWGSEVMPSNINEIVERAIAKTNAGHGLPADYRPPQPLINSVLSICRFGISAGLKAVSSGVPVVPAYVSSQSQSMVFEVIDKVVKERLSDDSLKNPNVIPQLEKLLDIWTRDSKPETYTKSVLHAIHAVRTVRSERGLT